METKDWQAIRILCKKSSSRRSYHHTMEDYLDIGDRFSESIGIVALLLNSAQAFLILRHKKMKTPFDISVFGVCIADLIALIFFLINFICVDLLTYNVARFDWSIPNFVSIVGFYFSMTASLLLTLFIAVQRLFAVYSPLKFRIYFTIRRCCYCLVFILIMSFLPCLHAYSFQNVDMFLYGVIICGCLLILCYMVICSTVYKRRERISAIAPNQTRRTIRTLKYCVMITISFLMCTFPFAIHAVIKESLKSILFLILLNPLFNSLLYFVFNHRKPQTCCTCCYSYCCCNRPSHRRVNISGESERRSGCFVLTEMHRDHVSCHVNGNYVSDPRKDAFHYRACWCRGLI